jgi:hypothetical protein
MSWQKMKESFDDYHLRQLVDEAFSTNPRVAVLARAELKRDYPDIYEQLEEVKK